MPGDPSVNASPLAKRKRTDLGAHASEASLKRSGNPSTFVYVVNQTISGPYISTNQDNLKAFSSEQAAAVYAKEEDGR